MLTTKVMPTPGLRINTSGVGVVVYAGTVQQLEDAIVWSATDLTAAAGCEFGLLSELDRRLGRSPKLSAPDDPLLEQIAELGNRHERAELERLREVYGPFDAATGSGVRELARAAGRARPALEAVAAATAAAFNSGADILYQSAFFDGSFHGYADFVRGPAT